MSYNSRTITVGDIRKVIENMPDDVAVTIFIPENCKPGMPNYMRFVSEVKDAPASPISNRELEIVAGEYFAY